MHPPQGLLLLPLQRLPLLLRLLLLMGCVEALLLHPLLLPILLLLGRR